MQEPKGEGGRGNPEPSRDSDAAFHRARIRHIVSANRGGGAKKKERSHRAQGRGGGVEAGDRCEAEAV